MGLLKTVFGSDDWDSILSYRTVGLVVIRDRRLGALNLFLMLCIVTFVLLQLLMGGTYLAVHDVDGNARFTLLQPTSNCTTKQRESGEWDCFPCDYTEPPCYDMFPNVTTIPYCTQSPAEYPPAAPGGPKKRLCRFEESSATSKVFQSSMLVSTRGRELKEEKVCSASPTDDNGDPNPLYHGGVCDNIYNITNNPKKDTYYYADVESFSVNVFHSIDSPMQKTCSEMNGALYVPNNDRLCDILPKSMTSYPDGPPTQKAPCWVEPVKGAYGSDIFEMSTLLGAADTSLDELFSPGSDHTIRDSGTILVLRIEYLNWNPWEVMFSTADPRYEYHLTTLRNTSIMATDVIYDHYPNNRTSLLRWGVQLTIVQSGVLRNFSIMQLLITLTTSLTLISITTVLVDTISTNIMGDSTLYKDYKLTVTPDISDIKDGKVCATCSRTLLRHTTEAPACCPVCEKAFPANTVLFRCEKCSHDRCSSCLTKTTFNNVPTDTLYELCLQFYDGDNKGYLSPKEMTLFEEDCEGDLERVPNNGGVEAFIDFLNAIPLEEKVRRRVLLLEKTNDQDFDAHLQDDKDALGRPLIQREITY